MACSAAAVAAAGWLVSPFLDSLSSRIRSCADDLFRYLPSGSASDDLDRLTDYLLRLHAFASAVERARRRPSHPTLLAWLNRLQDAAHDADDILDEVHYRRLADALTAPRPDLCSILDTPGELCSRLVPVCSDHPLNRLPSVLDKLATACADYAGIASLVGIDAADSLQRGNRFARNSSSIIPPDDAFLGRQRELAGLMERLLGCNGSAQLRNQRVPVVAIVGDGGIGKTMLAQMVFNHGKIQEHFHPLMWVCASTHVDDVRLTREILQAATDWKVDYDGIVNFDGLQTLLGSAVEGRRFLLILDDVWDDKEMSMWENVERWRKLLAPLQKGKQESRIIVTTRMKMVADMLGVRSPMMLGGLGTEENWLLLKKCALGSEKSREFLNLQEIGKKIVLNLKGSPLAARVIGGMLCNTRRPREWNNILETDVHGDIVSTLLSSYYHLPEHLQYCFAYCSIFPKNWKFERKKLVRMWIAQGFVQMENENMEDLGIEYFKQLLARSFFHTLRQGNRTHYVMHDLIHDLAQMVSRCDCARVEGDMYKNIPSTVRHVSVSSNSLPQLKKHCDMRRLRTLVVYNDSSMTSSTIPDGFLAELKNVRTLDLTGCLISELPEAIGYLIHLRYIALPGTIKLLPESVSTLLHLQTLDIPKKCQLDRFPEGMHQLVNLRHLGLDLKYISMIRGIGSLVKLQGSIEFHVKEEDRQTLVELKDMRDLHGLLHIKNLENVQFKEEACNAQLFNKRYLKILKLEWNTASAFGPIMDAEVLESLQPNTNLEELHIKRYKGESSPSWLEVKVLSQLKSLYLTNCRKWKLLPPLGQLPFLRVLHLKEMCSVTEIGLKFYGGGTFPSLKDLEFDDMPNLISWTGENGGLFFPRLQKLKILNCPKLIEMPLLPPTTRSVTVERSQKVSNLKLAPYCSSKSGKFVLEISSASILSEAFLHQKHLEATEVLNIRGCGGLVLSEGFQLLASLRKLRLSQCNIDGEHLRLCLQHLTGLASLDIVYCQNITSFLLPVGSRIFKTLQHLCFQDCQMLSSLDNLESFVFLKCLIIERCIRITTESLPSELKGMVSLNKLSILHCPGFQSLPNNMPLSLECFHLIGCHPLPASGQGQRPRRPRPRPPPSAPLSSSARWTAPPRLCSPSCRAATDATVTAPKRSSHAPSARVARPSKPPHPRQPCHQASPRIHPSFSALTGALRRRHWPNFGSHHRDLATVTGAALQIAAAPRHPVLRHLVPKHLRCLVRRSPPSIESRSPCSSPPPCLHSASSTSPSPASLQPPRWAPCPSPASQCRGTGGALRASPSPCRDAPAPARVHAPSRPHVHPAEGRRLSGGDTAARVGGAIASGGGGALGAGVGGGVAGGGGGRSARSPVAGRERERGGRGRGRGKEGLTSGARGKRRKQRTSDLMYEVTASRTAREKVYLAVGDDTKQYEFFLRWALNFIPPQMFGISTEIPAPPAACTAYTPPRAPNRGERSKCRAGSSVQPRGSVLCGSEAPAKLKPVVIAPARIDSAVLSPHALTGEVIAPTIRL
ncbi:hypothetical protein U9M48_016678 [Paspalum notatum var. saurae]|uniref:Uncharacterized protein n=1 Tax=Paspalum notatum var. saurae TaxID=547442 RepID=A0AAQ3WNH1_PASNO